MDGDGYLDPIAGRTALINHLTSDAACCDSAVNSTGELSELTCAGTTSLSRADMELVGTALAGQQTTLLLLGGDALVRSPSERARSA